MKPGRLTAIGLIIGLGGCPRPGDPSTTAQERPPSKPASEPETKEQEEPAPSLDDPHRIVFADRTSQGYLLLVSPGKDAKPTREQLGKLVREKIGKDAGPEKQLLLELVATEPQIEDPKLIAAARADWQQRMEGRKYFTFIPDGQRPPEQIR